MGTRNAYTGQITPVGSNLLETSISVPFRGLLHQVSFFVSAGTAVSQVRGQVGRVASALGLDILYKAALTPDVPLGADVPAGLLEVVIDGGVFYNVAITGATSGVLWVQVAADDATLDHTIDIELVIEDLYVESGVR
jgi:hypothetical protein